MKKLLLVRHATAQPESANGDFDRALSNKGINEATELAQKLKNNKIIPQLVVASSSLRTQTTAGIITNVLQLPKPQLNTAIYEASEQTLLKAINAFADTNDFTAMVGHNPGISYLLFTLTGEIRDVPPGTAILITFDVNEWNAVSSNSGTIVYYTAPEQAA
jgi:phosphohistidine phosphatase